MEGNNLTDTEVAKKILSAGYFSKELTKIFTSNELAEKYKEIKITNSELTKKGLNKWCKLIDYSIPKNNNLRRVISIPHPLHYIRLATEIGNHWEELSTYYEKSKFSLTTPVKSSVGEIGPRYSMSEKNNRRLEGLVGKRYILFTDITRYYPSIYTHSISWAYHTKEVAKLRSSMKDSSLLGNRLDILVRNMQDGQTMGLPIGPITSLIIEEIVGTAIDVEFEKALGEDVSGYRYTDDMEFYFNTYEEADKALNSLNKIVRKYELDLNSNKTKIVKIPHPLEKDWFYFFKNFKFSHRKGNYDIEIKVQKNNLKEFFDRIFQYKDETNDKGIAKYAFTILRKEIILRENWSFFEALLLQLIIVDTSTTSIVFETIEGYKYRGYPINLERLSKFINVFIKDIIEMNNDFEVSWALNFVKNMRINLDKGVVDLLLKIDNAIIMIQVMLLEDEKLLGDDPDFDFYKSMVTEESLYEDTWMFTYECHIQGWFGNVSDFVSKDKFFSQLSSRGISFINKHYSEISEIVGAEIVSLCLKEYKRKPESTVKELVDFVIQTHGFSLGSDELEKIQKQIAEKTKTEATTPEVPEAGVEAATPEVPETGVEAATPEVPETGVEATTPEVTEKEVEDNWISAFVKADISNIRAISFFENDYY